LLHRRVTAVEANRHMAALARRIIAANGLSGQITVSTAPGGGVAGATPCAFP
jgi:predicted O-methyltransferase YrrM